MAAGRQFFTLALLLALLLAGCASDVRWTKPDTDDETMAKDMAQCRRQAQVAYGGAAASLPPTQVDPRFGPTGPSQSDRVMQESQAVANCMRSKGYKLITVEKK
jgi:hypothetical protein